VRLASLLGVVLNPLPSFAQHSAPDVIKAMRVDSPLNLVN
jgi:hypothetical protein